jgi:hypothetical protein
VILRTAAFPDAQTDDHNKETDKDDQVKNCEGHDDLVGEG